MRTILTSLLYGYKPYKLHNNAQKQQTRPKPSIHRSLFLPLGHLSLAHNHLQNMATPQLLIHLQIPRQQRHNAKILRLEILHARHHLHVQPVMGGLLND